MLDRTLRVESAVPDEDAILLGTLADLKRSVPQLRVNGDLAPDAFLTVQPALESAATRCYGNQ